MHARATDTNTHDIENLDDYGHIDYQDEHDDELTDMNGTMNSTLNSSMGGDSEALEQGKSAYQRLAQSGNAWPL